MTFVYYDSDGNTADGREYFLDMYFEALSDAPSANEISMTIGEDDESTGPRALYAYEGTKTILNFPQSNDVINVGDDVYEYYSYEENDYFYNYKGNDYFTFDYKDDAVEKGENQLTIALTYTDIAGNTFTEDKEGNPYEVSLTVQGIATPPESISNIALAETVDYGSGPEDRGSLEGYIGEEMILDFPVAGDKIVAGGRVFEVKDNDSFRFESEDGDYFTYSYNTEEFTEGKSDYTLVFEYVNAAGSYTGKDYEYAMQNIIPISDVTSMTYKLAGNKTALTVYEGLDGVPNEEGEGFLYEPGRKLPQLGDEISVVFKNETEPTVYQYDEESSAFVNKDSNDNDHSEELYVTFGSNQDSDPDKWVVGANGLKFFATSRGGTADINVNLAACPVKEIELDLTDATIKASDLLEDGFLYLTNRGTDDTVFKAGDKIVVTYDSESGMGNFLTHKETYTYKYNDGEDSFLDFYNNDNEVFSPWYEVISNENCPFEVNLLEGKNTITLKTSIDKLIGSEGTEAELNINDDLSSQDAYTWSNAVFKWNEDNTECTAKADLENGANLVGFAKVETAGVTETVTEPATCTEGGKSTLKAVFKDSIFADEKYSEYTEKVKDTPAKGHTEVEIPAVEPTCTTDGSTGGKKCSVCNTVLEEPEVVDALDHTWSTPSYIWAEDGSKASAERHCTREGCMEKEEEEVTATSEVTKAATCDSKGETTYTAAFTKECFETQTKTLKDIEKAEHNWGAWTSISDEQHQRVCLHNSTHAETGNHDWDAGVRTKPTYEEDGKVVYTCTICGETKEEKTEDSLKTQAATAKANAEAAASVAEEAAKTPGAAAVQAAEAAEKAAKDAAEAAQRAANAAANDSTLSDAEKKEANDAATAASEAYETAKAVTKKANEDKAAAEEEAKKKAEEEARKKAEANKEIVDLPAVKISKPKAAKKKITVKWKKVSKKNLKKIGGIEIQVTGPNGYNKTYTAGAKKTSKAIKKLASKQKYRVRVRAYKWISGRKHVSKWSGWKSVKVK